MAAITSAVIAGGAAVYGASKASSAAKKAAGASQQATDQATALQREIFQQQQANQAPWLNQGTQAVNLLGQFYGFNPSAPPTTQAPAPAPAQTPSSQHPGTLFDMINQGRERFGMNPLSEAMMGAQASTQATTQAVSQTQTPTSPTSPAAGATTPAPNPQQAAMDRFFASPDYQFRLNEGNRNILGNAAATGGLQSGDTLKALQNYGQNTASGEFGNFMNRLAGLAGTGQTAASNAGQAGQNYANNVGNLLTQNAANRGTSYMNQANAWSQGVGGLAGSLAWGANQFPRG